MKFEKISENKLKIVLSNSELPNSKNLDDLMSNSDEARNSFLDLLDKANEKVGFNTSDYKIRIDAKAMLNGDFIFLITKLVKIRNNKVVVHPKKVIKDSNVSSIYSIYKFDTFEDVCAFCMYLKKNKINYLKTFSKTCKLYKYANKYYLEFMSINEGYKYLAKFYTAITEFSKYYSSKELFVSALQERGELLMDNNALITCQKYFINK